MPSCDVNHQLRALRDENRRLQQRINQFEQATNGCGECETCCVNFTTPGMTHSTGVITLTWASLPGMVFLVESSPDNDPETWTVITETLPAGTGATTALTIGLPDGAPVVYYRVREAPVNNEC